MKNSYNQFIKAESKYIKTKGKYPTMQKEVKK